MSRRHVVEVKITALIAVDPNRLESVNAAHIAVARAKGALDEVGAQFIHESARLTKTDAPAPPEPEITTKAAE